MKRILVVGAGGQIGSELTLRLREVYGGKNVVAADVRENSTLGADGPAVGLNALDKDSFGYTVNKYRIGTI